MATKAGKTLWALAAVLGLTACGGGSAPAQDGMLTTPVVAEREQSATAAPLGQTVWLKACTTQKFVSADRNLGTTAPLVANRDSAQGWEQFQVGDAGNDFISLRVVETGLYVSADPNAGGQVTGFRTAVGDWERFTWVPFADGSVGLRAKSTGQYVSADTNLGASAPLYANRATAGCWESFSFGVVGGGGEDRWVQVWSDEFDGNSVNTANWTPNTTVHVNSEQQQYTNSGDNISVSNGTLKLTARLQWNNGYPFTSGRLESAGKREFSHGRIEARIKMPVGAGLWPAFWMLGNDINSVGWPACGELDIMENVGYGDWVSGALHGPGYSGNTPINGRFYPSSSVSNWHVYRTEYSSSDIKWYIDGALVKTTTRAEVLRYGAWAYDKPLFIILNLAVGGGYPFGVNGASTPYYGVPQSTVDLVRNAPQTMEVDWVRAYQWR
ncbi:glycosyl hydrolase family protein [Corallococcus sp. AB030]|uniref:family 16 glycosylhydrolase n=1 Tax=Corallococcus sp. AB030 TaxID=2316716 RepID=UPI000EEA989F|nr:family 16 glycosylhydrolase [Corallococcus sp. AB030]RKI10693.1 glycosyl hydrolase family protein [Corallococcus sp. AB030]